MNHLHCIFFGILLLALIGCQNNSSDTKSSYYAPRKLAYGKPNLLTVIADENLWTGDLGDSLRYYFESPYLILPQMESVLDLKHFKPSEITSQDIRLRGRNILVVAAADDEFSSTLQFIAKYLGEERIRRAREDSSYNLIVVNDLWANGQTVYFQLAQSQQQLTVNIRTNFAEILRKIQENDAELIHNSVYQSEVSRDKSQLVTSKFGFAMDVPKDYLVAIDQPNILWMRKDTRRVTYNLLISSIPYNNATQFSAAGLKSFQDTLGKLYISSSIPGSYMRINDHDLPMYSESIMVDGHYGIEARGIWEMENDFEAGPFISYLLHDEETQKLYLINAFLLAPGQSKRNHMQYLTAILKTIRFPES